MVGLQVLKVLRRELLAVEEKTLLLENMVEGVLAGYGGGALWTC